MLNMNLGHGGFSVNKLNININININIIIQCRLFCQTYVLLETKAIILCLCFTFETTNWTGRRLWRISIGITTKKGRKAGCTILMHRTLQWKYTLLRRDFCARCFGSNYDAYNWQWLGSRSWWVVRYPWADIVNEACNMWCFS